MRKNQCRICNIKTNHEVVHEEKIHGSEEDGSFQWKDTYSIIRCKGCDNLSFLNIYGNTDMYYINDSDEQNYYFTESQFPKFLQTGEKIVHIGYLPDNIRNIYKETITSGISRKKDIQNFYFL